MNLDTFLSSLTDQAVDGGYWWAKAALWAAARGYWRAIPTRSDPDKLLLVRFWLNVPKKPANPGDIWESADSTMIHYLLEPDDELALHDHRWDFTSQILSGGYVEETPRSMRLHWRGCVIRHAATDLHRIAGVDEQTVSLVTTGPHLRDWGFQPAGKPWVSHEEFLK